MEQLDIVDLRNPLIRWSSTPFILRSSVCVCGSRIRAYAAYKINSDNFDRQALTQSLHRHLPLPHPCTWYVNLRVAAVVNVVDLQAFDRIHPHHHHHQEPPSRFERLTLQQIYSYLRGNKHQEEESEGVCCVVCHAEFKKNEMKGRLRCEHHQFHLDCIKEWLLRKNQCPICRRPTL